MTTSKVRTRVLALGATVLAVVGALAFVVPALASSPSEVRLHLGTDGRYFAYGEQMQALTTSGCKIKDAESRKLETVFPGAFHTPALNDGQASAEPASA